MMNLISDRLFLLLSRTFATRPSEIKVASLSLDWLFTKITAPIKNLLVLVERNLAIITWNWRAILHYVPTPIQGKPCPRSGQTPPTLALRSVCS